MIDVNGVEEERDLKGKFIDALEIGERVIMQAAVTAKHLKSTQQGKAYLDLTLADRTASINAKVWDGANDAAKKFDVESIIQVEAEVGEWEKVKQLTIRRLRVCKPEEFDLGNFVPSTPESIDRLWSDLESMIEYVSDEPTRLMLQKLTVDLRDSLRESPAAMKYHHAYRGGWLEHCVSMLHVADNICLRYRRIDKDLLMAGIVLHDVGKVRELKSGIAIDYTDGGKLVGHIVYGLLLLEQYGAGLSDDVKQQLQHLLISHHGQPEWGALKVPMTAEAIALHLIDKMDSSLARYWAEVDKLPAGERWTPYQGQQFYKTQEVAQ